MANNNPPISLSYAIIVVIVLMLDFAQSIDNPYRLKDCGFLYSEDNFGGAVFPMKDQDHSLHLEEDHRASSGWNETASINIAAGCEMKLCNGTYFDGSCKTLSQGSYRTSQMQSSLGFDVASVGCACVKVLENPIYR